MRIKKKKFAFLNSQRPVKKKMWWLLPTISRVNEKKRLLSIHVLTQFLFIGLQGRTKTTTITTTTKKRQRKKENTVKGAFWANETASLLNKEKSCFFVITHLNYRLFLCLEVKKKKTATSVKPLCSCVEVVSTTTHARKKCFSRAKQQRLWAMENNKPRGNTTTHKKKRKACKVKVVCDALNPGPQLYTDKARSTKWIIVNTVLKPRGNQQKTQKKKRRKKAYVTKTTDSRGKKSAGAA